MKSYFKVHPWKVIEEGFDPQYNEVAESVFAIGNGMMGQRANLEETYSGHTLQGTYVGGVYYPDKTRVGWWKNGYPEYFAKVINSTYWSGIVFFLVPQDHQSKLKLHYFLCLYWLSLVYLIKLIHLN